MDSTSNTGATKEPQKDTINRFILVIVDDEGERYCIPHQNIVSLKDRGELREIGFVRHDFLCRRMLVKNSFDELYRYIVSGKSAPS
jgi:hypothetical protein